MIRPRHNSTDGYTTRFLCCLAGSILVMIGVVHVPVGAGWSPVGWYVLRPAESISVDLVEKQTRTVERDSGTPITVFEDADHPSPGDGEDDREDVHESMSDAAETRASPPVERLRGRRIFDMAHHMPQIVGGIGAYYIHIEYPDEALNAGVEGRLMLSFIVEADGRTSDVEVIRPLFPACDSAAVRALRQTRFVPGRQNGEAVPVRMRLPVRFRLVDNDSPTSRNGSD